MKKYVLNYPLAKSHPLFLKLLKRFQNAIQRNAFNNNKNHTPVSVINASKYIIGNKNQTIFILTPHKLFEKLMNELHVIVKRNVDSAITPDELLELLFNSEDFRDLFDDITAYSWAKSFKDFYYHMIEESFFYFTDGVDDYYFNLFRFVNRHQFVGGILHSLGSHYEDFNMIHKSSDRNKYEYNRFMYDLINCSLNGIIISKRLAKVPSDYHLHKELQIGNRYLNVVLYWDDLRKIYFITTAYESNVSKINVA